MSRVSIGLPVFNGENFLKDALNSILAQTYRDFELIISDNASTDNTEEICREYAASDARIRYCRGDVTLGSAWNFNRVLELASGVYFKWASHDDVVAPDLLRTCVEVLDRDLSVVLVYARSKFIDEHGKVLGTYDPDTKGFDSHKPYDRFGARTSRIRPPFPFLGPRREDAHPVFGLIRVSALRAVPPLGAFGASDQILLARLALLGRFHRIPEYWFFNREHSQRSITAYRGRRRQTLWLDPEKANSVLFPDWRMFWEFLISIPPAKLTPYERLRCYGKIGKYLLWNWPKMIRDLLVAARQVIASVSRLGVKARPLAQVLGRRA